MRKIPQNTNWTQLNRGNLLSDLWSTWNIDLQSNLGAVRVTPRLKLNTATASDADLGRPVAFKHYGGKIWAICDTHIFTNNGTASGAFTDDAVTSFQTDYSADESDLEIFNGVLCATTTDALYSTDGSSWTSRDTLSTGTAHVMTYFKKFDRLYYSNGTDNVLSINSSWATADPGADYAISLSTSSNSYTITSLKAAGTKIWIGVVDENSPNKKGKVLEWDGFSADVSSEYELNNPGCMAIAINPKNNQPYAVDGAGIIYGFTGAGFSEVGRLPFGNRLAYNPVDADNERFLHPNGLAFSKDGTLYLNIINRPNTSTNPVPETLPSGIWEWSENNGVVHKYSFSYNPVSSSTITDFGQGRIAGAGAIALMDIERNEVSADGSLIAGATYYTDATTTTSGIFTDNSLDTIQKNGYLVTTKVFSSKINDKWERATLRFRQLLNSGDKITLKFRTKEEAPTEATITWTSTTTFTTSTDVSAYSGYEVEVLRGTGSGKCAQIVSVSNNAGTYTVTVDEAFTGVTNGTATARFQKWKKSDSETGQATDYKHFALNQTSTWIQLKVIMQVTGENELYDITIDNHSNM